jgi:hypothetical protein
MCSIFFILALLVGATQAFAQAGGPQIFDMRKNLPLEPDEPVYHDFYISAGSEAGFKKGLYVTVVRRVPIHDPIQNKQQATMNVTVGKLQIVHVEHGLAVGRVYSETGDDERPTVEFEGIMIGDHVDLAGSSMEAPAVKKKAVKKPVKTAEAETIEVRVQARVETAKAEKPAPAKAEPATEMKGEVAGLAPKAQAGEPSRRTQPATVAPTAEASKKTSEGPVSVPIPAPAASKPAKAT